MRRARACVTDGGLPWQIEVVNIHILSFCSCFLFFVVFFFIILFSLACSLSPPLSVLSLAYTYNINTSFIYLFIVCHSKLSFWSLRLLCALCEQLECIRFNSGRGQCWCPLKRVFSDFCISIYLFVYYFYFFFCSVCLYMLCWCDEWWLMIVVLYSIRIIIGLAHIIYSYIVCVCDARHAKYTNHWTMANDADDDGCWWMVVSRWWCLMIIMMIATGWSLSKFQYHL